MDTRPISAALPARNAAPAGTHRQEAALVLITMIWGGTFLAVKTMLGYAGPYTVVGLRFGIAALITALLLRSRLAGLTRAELRGGLAVGVALFFGYTLQTQALQFIPSSKSAFLTGLYVPLVPLMQWAATGRRPGGPAWVGIALALAGTALLAGPEGFALTLGPGEALTILGTVAIALEILLLSRHAAQCDAGRLAFVQLVVVAVLCAPMALLREEPPLRIEPASLALLAALATATAGIQFAMNWAQQAVSATRATLIYAGEPVWAGLVGWLAGDALGLGGWSGAALIVAAMVVSKRRSFTPGRATRPSPAH